MTIRRLPCLALLAALVFSPPLAAQISLPGIKIGQPGPAPAAKPVAEQRAQAEADLNAVRRLQEENAAAQPADADAAAYHTERQRLLDVLIYYKNEKLWRLDDLAALQKTPSPAIADNPLIKALGGTPPYSVLRVDALRDEFDAQKERLQSLQNDLQTHEGEKQQVQERLRKASEALRLAADKAAQEGSEAARRRREIADLNKQLAEVELATQAVDQEYVRAQAAALKPQIDEMSQWVGRLLPGQKLAESELAEKRANLRDTQEKLSAEIDKIAARHARRLTERQRLLAAATPNGAPPPRLSFLEQALKADSMTLESLRALQLMEQIHADAWEQRIVLFSANATPEERTQAIASLRKIVAALSNEAASGRQRMAADQEKMRAAIVEQEARVARQQPNSPEAAQAQEVLALYRQALAAYERITQLVDRLGRQTSRWLDDFAGPGEASLAGQALGAWQTVKNAAASIWNYELFAVEDTSQADGQKITVSYGVTVGKSIGSLVLFAFGYWLFSRLTRRILRLLVEHGGVDAQVASVTRRWLMISVAVILVIFILNLTRIPLTVFAFVGGALAIGIGFGTQTIIKNFISGIILLFERKVRVGDIVAIGGVTGTVASVDLRSTTVKAFDGVEALIPNANVLENQVVNWTYSDTRLRREIRLQIEYGAPVREATHIILACAEEHGQILKNPAPEVYFDDFAESGLNIGMTFWVELGPNINGRRIDSDLRFMIEKRLAATGIGIPFPTREVSLRSGQPLPVKIVVASKTADSLPAENGDGNHGAH